MSNPPSPPPLPHTHAVNCDWPSAIAPVGTMLCRIGRMAKCLPATVRHTKITACTASLRLIVFLSCASCCVRACLLVRPSVRPCYICFCFLFLCVARFLPFLEHTVDMHDFCQREVEPMGKECEMVKQCSSTVVLSYVQYSCTSH